VLAELPGSYPPRTSRLLVLDAPRLAVRARLALPGWSTVDAISPNGRWLYLIHYTSSNATDYEVLAYDLLARRMLAKPIVDPRDREEEMTGIPVSRVMSADGRWAYTFYMRPSGVPFVHALDTSGLRAVCIDLPSLANGDLGSAHLRLLPGGTTLGIETDAGYQAQIDTRTFAVRTAANPFVPAPVTPGPRPHRRAGASGDTQWTVIALAVALLGVLAAAAAVAGRRPRTRPSRVGEVTDAPSGAVGHWVVEEGREPPVVDVPLVSGDVPRSRG
jgi:hypothetical protein